MLDIPPHPEGLPSKIFNQHFDGLLTHGNLNPEIIEFMNEYQQNAVNEVKKALSRIENKHARQTSEDTERVESTEGTV